MVKKGLFEKYGQDAVDNEYYDYKRDREFVVMDYEVNKSEKEVALRCRSYDEETDKYEFFEVNVMQIIEMDRFKHLEGSAEKVK